MMRTLLWIVGIGLAALAFAPLATWDPSSHAYERVVGWFFATSDSSPQLIMAIVAGLLVARRDALRAALGAERAPLLAGGVGLLALGLHGWGLWADATDLLIPSLGLGGIALGLLLGGRPLARELLAPLAILVFALPLPGALHNLVVYPYQLRTAAFVDALLRAADFTVSRQGDMLKVGAREFEVIETCSGLRSALTLGLLASVWVTWFRCSAWHGALLLASSPLIAFGTNAIRVIVLVLDPRPEVQESHVAQGLVMFVVGTGALSLVDRLLLRLRRHRELVEDAGAASVSPVATGRLRAAALGLVPFAALTLALPGWRPAAVPFAGAVSLPEKLPGWRVAPGPETGHFLGQTWFTHRSHHVYRSRDRRPRVTAFLGLDDHQVRSRSLLSVKNHVPGPSYVILEQGERWLLPGPRRMESFVVQRFGKRELVLTRYEGVGSVAAEILRSALALDQPGSPWRRTEPARFLRLSTPIFPGPDGVREAETRLRAFYARLPGPVRGDR